MAMESALDVTKIFRQPKLEATRSEGGSPSAELELGYLYEAGRGVPLDCVSAYAWYARAQAEGKKQARTQMRRPSRAMAHEQIENGNDQALAIVRPSTFRPIKRATRAAIGRSFVENR
jgi:TPR repeat protein